MTVAIRTLEKYNEDKVNFVIKKVTGGWNITNIRTMKMYHVYKEAGEIKCNCPDYIHRKSLTGEACKHIVAIRKNADDMRLAEIQKFIDRW